MLSEDECTLQNLSYAIKDMTEALCGLEDERDYLTLMARQMLSAGLSEVDWREIAQSVLDEA